MTNYKKRHNMERRRYPINPLFDFCNRCGKWELVGNLARHLYRTTDNRLLLCEEPRRKEIECQRTT